MKRINRFNLYDHEKLQEIFLKSTDVVDRDFDFLNSNKSNFYPLEIKKKIPLKFQDTDCAKKGNLKGSNCQDKLSCKDEETSKRL